MEGCKIHTHCGLCSARGVKICIFIPLFIAETLMICRTLVTKQYSIDLICGSGNLKTSEVC